ncbi:unnamed protein product [Absidia cylindrospora]
MTLQPVSSRNAVAALTKNAVATPSAHYHLTIRQVNDGIQQQQQQQQQQQHQQQQQQQYGYHDQRTIMWAASTNHHQFCNSNSGDMAPEYSAQSSSMIVSPPQQHINSHCSVTGPAYNLNRNRSLMPGPPSPPIHHHHQSPPPPPPWSMAVGADERNNNHPYDSAWIGPPPPVDEWQYPILHQSTSGSPVSISYPDHHSSSHFIVSGTSKSLGKDMTEPLLSKQGPSTHESEGRHGDCISPTSPSPSILSFSSTSILHTSSSTSKTQNQLHDHDMTEEENKRQLYLVKNRQAASKCRQRKKEWIAQMQETMTSFTAENDVLQQQVIMLREEVLSLKTLLLMCKDCPQAQANGVYGLDSMISSNWRCS